MSVQGSCHCGKIDFTLDADPAEAMECNCSICRRKGYLLAFYPPEKFSLHTARDAIAVYTFNKHVIRHQFCKVCGCAPFGEGVGSDGKNMIAVNLRCVPDVDLEALKITQYDGASA